MIIFKGKKIDNRFFFSRQIEIRTILFKIIDEFFSSNRSANFFRDRTWFFPRSVRTFVFRTICRFFLVKSIVNFYYSFKEYFFCIHFLLFTNSLFFAGRRRRHSQSSSFHVPRVRGRRRRSGFQSGFSSQCPQTQARRQASPKYPKYHITHLLAEQTGS